MDPSRHCPADWRNACSQSRVTRPGTGRSPRDGVVGRLPLRRATFSYTAQHDPPGSHPGWRSCGTAAWVGRQTDLAARPPRKRVARGRPPFSASQGWLDKQNDQFSAHSPPWRVPLTRTLVFGGLNKFRMKHSGLYPAKESPVSGLGQANSLFGVPIYL